MYIHIVYVAVIAVVAVIVGRYVSPAFRLFVAQEVKDAEAAFEKEKTVLAAGFQRERAALVADKLKAESDLAKLKADLAGLPAELEAKYSKTITDLKSAVAAGEQKVATLTELFRKAPSAEPFVVVEQPVPAPAAHANFPNPLPASL